MLINQLERHILNRCASSLEGNLLRLSIAMLKLMRKLSVLIINIKFIFMPHFWSMDNTYSRTLDRLMIKIMKRNKFIKDGRCYAYLGKTFIWVCNYPHASYVINNKRPSRQTIYLLNKKFNKETKGQGMTGYWDKLIGNKILDDDKEIPR